MKTNFNILVATDYSTAVMNAERYAVQFAKDTNSTIRFFHVFDPIAASDILSQNPDIMDVDRPKVEIDKLLTHVSSILKSLNIKSDELNYECYVGEGSAGNIIIEEAKEWGADFIVVGTHGVSGFRDFTLGTHAWNVIKKAIAPVLAIPQNARYTGVKNIVFATEYREGEVPVINFLTQIAKQFDANVTLLHINDGSHFKEIETMIERDFNQKIKNEIGYEKLTAHIEEHENIATGLNSYCEKSKTDWIVMSPQKPFLLERIFSPNNSTTKRVSLTSTVPLLTIPDFEYPMNKGFW